MIKRDKAHIVNGWGNLYVVWHQNRPQETMNYDENRPRGILKHFIKYFWTYEHTGEDADYTILPDACFDLLADFEGGVLQNVILTGIWTKPVKVTVTKGTTLLAVRFKILAAEYLFRREIRSLLNTMISLPTDFWNLHSYHSTEFEKFAENLSSHMVMSLKQLGDMDKRKIKLFEIISREECPSVKELSEKVAWSSRQINRYFNRQFGFPLKTYLNMVRCNAAYRDISQGRLHPTQEYTDQAHFIKEVKKFTKETPRQLYKNENDRFLQLSVLARK